MEPDVSERNILLHDVKDLGYSLSPFIKDLPKLRKEYRKFRSGLQIQIADETRMGFLKDFIHVSILSFPFLK